MLCGVRHCDTCVMFSLKTVCAALSQFLGLNDTFTQHDERRSERTLGVRFLLFGGFVSGVIQSAAMFI